MFSTQGSKSLFTPTSGQVKRRAPIPEQHDEIKFRIRMNESISKQKLTNAAPRQSAKCFNDNRYMISVRRRIILVEFIITKMHPCFATDYQLERP